MLKDIQFANPQFFVLLIFVPLLIYWYWWKERGRFPELQLSTLESFKNAPKSWRQRFRHLLFFLRVLAVVLLIVALARPQSVSRGEKVTTEGIDIVLVTDISGSMLAEDFKPNRIEAAKNVAKDFVGGRQNDRIGLVVFGGESFTQCPLTMDHAVVQNLIGQLRSGIVEDGTAIGMGLATAVSRLKDSKAKSRVIILLTDGVNNRGFIDPITASGIAHSFGIRVYTVGVGTKGMAPYPFQTSAGMRYQNVPVEIDEDMLKKIAAQTGGKYFRATDNDKLSAIYHEIDQLEKTKMEVLQFRKHKEQFFAATFSGSILLLFEMILSQTLFRRLP
jgi:Ca-activated chloride channel family protein